MFKRGILPGRDAPIRPAAIHAVLGTPTGGSFDGYGRVLFGLGCFWGAERLFWKVPGVHSTQVGYAAGQTPNPTYKEVCSGRTGHNEVVRVIFDRKATELTTLLAAFWEAHDPTQGLRQGNDVGSQYRSGIYVYSAGEKAIADASRAAYQQGLTAAGLGQITTEILDAPPFYFAEDYHQQYLHKNPQGYCGLRGTGVSCVLGTDVER